ncbi:MAG: hypothetical protein CHACPFDD_01720 [Phycisphaerae bacterium]|nr:hypothetical protein [Phycisphaerae bacterium]
MARSTPRNLAAFLASALAAATLGEAPKPARAADEVLADGFAIETYAEGLDEPIALEFAPDGRLFVAQRGGIVRVVRAGDTAGAEATGDGPAAAARLKPGARRAALADAEFARVEVITQNENGLLGLALDPDFTTNGYVYLFATISTEEQQIIRFTDRDGLGQDMTVIRDHLPTRGEFHSGGGLKFGPDGKLYFAIGDNLVQENAQDMSTLAGKISRIDPDGSTPADNPFTTPTGSPRAIFALGFRNPFRICFAPDGRLFALDVGSDGDGRREEINLVRSGRNYGWPLVEGRQSVLPNPLFTDPIYDYHDGGAAPTGAVYYSAERFPAEYRGNLFHLEFVLNRLYRTVLDGDEVVSHDVFVQGDGGPVDLALGPDGALYYCEIYTGNVKRVDYTLPVEPVVQGETDVDASFSDVATPRYPCGLGALFAAPLVAALWAVRSPRRRH